MMDKVIALRTVNELLGGDFGFTCKGDELKGVMIDREEGGVCKNYINAQQAWSLYEAFRTLAEELEKVR